MTAEQFETELQGLEDLLHDFSFLDDFSGRYERLLQETMRDKTRAVSAIDKRACFVRAVNLRVLLARQVAWLTGVRERMAAQGEGHGSN